MWAVYWTPGRGAGCYETMERVKVRASSFDDAMQKARKMIPEEARIIECEPVGSK